MASSNPVSGNNTTATTTVVTETPELGNEETLRLKLKKGEAAEKKKIQWTEDTVDNEGESQVHIFTSCKSSHFHFL